MRTVSINDYELMRAKDGRMLAGVAAGLAKTAGLDVTIVRLCIGAMMLSGFGIPAYILMWIVVPEESPSRGRVLQPAPEQMARIIRIALVVLGALALLNKVGDWGIANPHTGGVGLDGALGLVLVGVGIAVLFSRHRPDGAIGTVHDAVSDTLREVRTTFAEATPRAATPRAATPTIDEDGYYLDDEDVAPELDPEPAPTRLATAIVAGDTRSSGGAALGWARVVGWFCLIWWTLSAIGLVAMWALGAVGVRSPIVLSVAGWLVFIAVLNTLLHAKFARAILPALALLLIPVGLAAATTSVNGEVGHFVHRPGSALEIRNYDVAAGYLELDLSHTRFEHPKTITARVGAGRLDAIVPNNATVTVDAQTSAGGAYEIFGRNSNGFSPDDSRTYPGCEGGPKLTLHLKSGAGFILVKRANGDIVPAC